MISSHGCVGCRVVISVDFYCCPTPGSAGLVPCWAARRTAQTVCVAGWCSMPNHRCRCTGTKPVMFVCLYSYLTTECFRCMDISTIVSTMGPPVTGPPFPWSHTQWYERCVCVWTIWTDVKPLFAGIFLVLDGTKYQIAGGPSMYCERWSNEATTVHADITADHRDVPASFFHVIFRDGTWLTQEPPCRFQTTCFQFPRLHGFRNLNFLPTISDGTVAYSWD